MDLANSKARSENQLAYTPKRKDIMDIEVFEKHLYMPRGQSLHCPDFLWPFIGSGVFEPLSYTDRAVGITKCTWSQCSFNSLQIPGFDKVKYNEQDSYTVRSD
jgi:hypothetical protein